MKHQSRKERESQIIQTEIDRCRQKYENAQVYYGYGSYSAGKTMEKYSTLKNALESYLTSRDERNGHLSKLLEIGEAMNRAERQIELYGEMSLPVRRVIEEVKRLISGGGPK